MDFNDDSDHRSNIAPSDSERDCPSRRDSEATNNYSSTNPFLSGPPPNSSGLGSRLEVNPCGNDSESGGSQSPSPRASRRRQVWLKTQSQNL